MRHWPAAPGTVPVFFAGLRRHGVARLDPLRLAAPDLDPTVTGDHVQHLTTAVRMPVIAHTGLEPDHRDESLGRRRGSEQFLRLGFASEAALLDWLQMIERLRARCEFHETLG